MDGLPQDLGIDAEILMYQDVAHALHEPPGDLRQVFLDGFRNVTACFPDDLKIANNRIKSFS